MLRTNVTGFSVQCSSIHDCTSSALWPVTTITSSMGAFFSPSRM